MAADNFEAAGVLYRYRQFPPKRGEILDISSSLLNISLSLSLYMYIYIYIVCWTRRSPVAPDGFSPRGALEAGGS